FFSPSNSGMKEGDCVHTLPPVTLSTIFFLLIHMKVVVIIRLLFKNQLSNFAHLYIPLSFYVITPSGHQPGNKVGKPGRQRGKPLLVMEPL
ncbi:TPA: hypothetical protein ACHJU3_004446, partial [Escherichia coli]